MSGLSLIQELVLSDEMQPFLNAPDVEEYTMECADVLLNQVPYDIYNYVNENIDEFLVIGDLESTKNNISNFTSDWYKSAMFEMISIV